MIGSKSPHHFVNQSVVKDLLVPSYLSKLPLQGYSKKACTNLQNIENSRSQFSSCNIGKNNQSKLKTYKSDAAESYFCKSVYKRALNWHWLIKISKYLRPNFHVTNCQMLRKTSWYKRTRSLSGNRTIRRKKVDYLCFHQYLFFRNCSVCSESCHDYSPKIFGSFARLSLCFRKK